MTLLDRRWHAPPNWAHTQQTYFVFVIIVQERVPGDDTSREKAKIDDKDKHVATDHTSNTNAENSNYLFNIIISMHTIC